MFIYADDLCLARQSKSFIAIGRSLNECSAASSDKLQTVVPKFKLW